MGSASTVCDGLSWIHCWQPLSTTHPNAFFCHMFTFHPETIEVGQLKILCHLTEKYRLSSQGPNTTAGTRKIKVQVNKNNTRQHSLHGLRFDMTALLGVSLASP